MQIRSAGDSETETIKKLIYSVLVEYGLEPDPSGTDEDLEAIDESYHLNHGYFGVMEDDGKVFATIGLRRVDDHCCELRKMYMLSGYRGKGYGGQLMRFALNKAQKLGYQRVVLETASPLIEAIALYEKYGFQEYSPESLANRCDKAFELNLINAKN